MNLTRRLLGQWIAGLLVTKSLPCPFAAALEESQPIPLGGSSDPLAREFLAALVSERRVAFYYHGGTTPGALRVIRPESLFRLRPGGRIYVRGRCELRAATRVFRLDRARPA